MIIKQAHNIEVIDIKSGQFPTSKNINQYDYIQLGIYALMIENDYKDHTIKASLIGKDAKYKPMIDSESSEFHAYKQGLIRYITQLFDGLAHHKYQPDDALSSPKKQQINVAFAITITSAIGRISTIDEYHYSSKNNPYASKQPLALEKRH